MKQGKYLAAIEDCSKGLTVIPEQFGYQVPANASNAELEKIQVNPLLTRTLQIKLHAKRGTAYKELEEVKKAIDDFTTVINLDPSFKTRQIRNDLETLLKINQNCNKNDDPLLSPSMTHV